MAMAIRPVSTTGFFGLSETNTIGYYSAAKLRRDVPEYHPVVSLATGMRQVFAAMAREGRIPPAEGEAWEDHLIAWQTQQAQGTG
jgi:hypothetical protein